MLSATLALDVQFEHRSVVHEPVNSRDGHLGIWEHGVPLGERLIRGDLNRPVLIPLCDEFGQDAGFGLVFTHLGDVVYDQ